MVIGNIKEADTGFKKYPKRIREALAFLNETDFTKIPDGRIDIDDGMYANLQRYDTRVPESGKPEAHRKYVDVQFIAEGEEELGWCPINPDLVPVAPYDADKDLIFYQDLVPASTMPLRCKDFAILYPNDVHRPCGSLYAEPAKVTKVVVKIAVDSIKKD